MSAFLPRIYRCATDMMDDSQTPTQYMSDDAVFLENGHPIQVAVGPLNYRRSSSVTTSQTPFLKRESVRRISEPSFYIPPPEETKNCTGISVIVVVIVVLTALAGLLFYRLEVKNDDLQRQLSELKAEFEALAPRASTNNGGEAGDDENCVCSSEKSKQVDPNGSSSILQCCAQDGEKVKSLIEEAVKRELGPREVPVQCARKNESDYNSGHRSFAYAHVSGKSGTVKANNPMYNHMTGWIVKSAFRTSFSRGCIEIKHAGIYFVYSQIYFYTEQNPSEPTNITAASNHEPMLHETCRNEKPIMKSAVPYRDFTSKYHGGVFKLEQNDTISIRVSKNEYHVNLNPELTFFGVYSLEESSPLLPTTKSYN